MNKHTPIEALSKLKQVPIQHTYFSNNTTFYSEECVLDLLQSQADKYEGEKKEMAKEFMDTLHEIIPHTVLELEETPQSDYDRGYIFYQDLVVRAVLDEEKKIAKKYSVDLSE